MWPQVLISCLLFFSQVHARSHSLWQERFRRDFSVSELFSKPTTLFGTEDLFKLTDPNKAGYCDPTLARPVVQDTLALLKVASQALETLTAVDHQNQPIGFEMTRGNRVLAEIAKTLWGSEYREDHASSRIFISKGRDTLLDGLERYKELIRDLGQKQYTLTCGDGQWRWVRTYGEAKWALVNGASADTPVASEWSLDPERVRGIWWNDQLQTAMLAGEDGYSPVNPDGTMSVTGPCKETIFGGGKGAFTVLDNQIIVICSETGYSFAQHPPGHQQDETLEVVRRRSADSDIGADIGSFAIPGGLLLHEVTHAGYEDIIDHDTAMCVDNNEGYTYGYKWLDAKYLATRGLALTSAINFQFFALAVALLPDDYHTGKKGGV